ncbi:hypothetical protein C8N38_11043 [Rhodovulum kholense]|uniref:Uncharacterized protein n=1 Tax=Rhodovulum kholense TaxID=453584 RepID=A0A8E2VK16_9RHOB|nr:hypothetical protein C8N38_11043 [Rhodovulum kholense]
MIVSEVPSMAQRSAVLSRGAQPSGPGDQPGPRPILPKGGRIATFHAVERVAADCTMNRAALLSGDALPGSGASLFASHDQSASPEASR